MKKIFLFIILFQCLNGLFATIRYVMPTSQGAGNGTTWTNASGDLHAMLSASSVGDEVWVAAGTYKPSQDPFGNSSPTNPRNKAFFVKDGVKLYGGFAGTEFTLGERNIQANVTLLSGDVDNNNTRDAGNVYHVVIAADLTAANGVTIDGFSITQGSADVVGTSMTINGQTIATTNGAGVYIAGGTNNILANNRIYNNWVLGNGGGVYAPINTVLTITNCEIYNNSATNGGGSYCQGTLTFTYNLVYGQTPSNGGFTVGGGLLMFTGTASYNIFYNNTCTNGAAMRITNSIATVTNNVFYNNVATGQAGGIDIILNLLGNVQIMNNTFYNNQGSSGSGCINSFGSTASRLMIKNNILWENKLGGNSNVAFADYRRNSTAIKDTLSYNVLQLAYNTTNYPATSIHSNNLYAQNPVFLDASTPKGGDNLYRTSDDGLSLQSTSPAINAGSASGAPATDIIGTSRPQLASVDMGAYEYVCPAISVSITGLNAAYCKTSGVITLAGTPSGGTFTLDGNAATSFDANVLAAGSHTVTYSYNQGACSGSVSQNFTLYDQPNPPTITTTSNAPCVGASVTLTGVAPSGLTATEYAWFRNGTFVKYSNTSADYTFPALAGTNNYTLAIITSTSGICPSNQSASTPITSVAPVAVITPSTAPPYCVGAGPILNATPPTGTGYTYSWIGTSPSAASTTTATFTPTNSGNHRVIVTDGNGCSKSSAWLGIVLNALPGANAGLDKSVCMGSSVGLGTTAISGYTYSWSPSTDLSSATSATPTLAPSATGNINYTVTVTQTTTGCTKSDDVAVTTFALPATPALTSTSSPVCQGATITLIPSGAVGAINWYKNGSLSSAAATASQLTLATSTASADSYTIRAKNGACLSAESNPVSVWIKPAPTPTLSATPTIVSNVVSVCNSGQNNGIAQLLVNLPSGAPSATYNWQQVVSGVATNVSPAATSSIYTAFVAIAPTTQNNKIFRAQVTYSNACVKNTSNVTVKLLPSNCTRMGHTADLTEMIFTAYPNPTENVLIVHIQNSTASEGELVLYNTLGQVITSRIISLNNGSIEENLDLSGLASGIYTLSFQTQDGNQIQKIVKE